MKIIERGKHVGYQFRCYGCGAIVEIEEGDKFNKPEVIMNQPLVRVSSVDCPCCSSQIQTGTMNALQGSNGKFLGSHNGASN